MVSCSPANQCGIFHSWPNPLILQAIFWKSLWNLLLQRYNTHLIHQAVVNDPTFMFASCFKRPRFKGFSGFWKMFQLEKTNYSLVFGKWKHWYRPWVEVAASDQIVPLTYLLYAAGFTTSFSTTPLHSNPNKGRYDLANSFHFVLILLYLSHKEHKGRKQILLLASFPRRQRQLWGTSLTAPVLTRANARVPSSSSKTAPNCL